MCWLWGDLITGFFFERKPGWVGLWSLFQEPGVSNHLHPGCSHCKYALLGRLAALTPFRGGTGGGGGYVLIGHSLVREFIYTWRLS